MSHHTSVGFRFSAFFSSLDAAPVMTAGALGRRVLVAALVAASLIGTGCTGVPGGDPAAENPPPRGAAGEAHTADGASAGPSNVPTVVFEDLSTAHQSSATSSAAFGHTPDPTPTAPAVTAGPGTVYPNGTDTRVEPAQWSAVSPHDATADDLIRAYRSRRPADLARALDIATLQAMLPAGDVQDHDLTGLDTKTVSGVRLYRAMVAALRRTVLSGQAIDPEVAERVLYDSEEAPPIRISNLVLCQRVQGYGVYDPRHGHGFMAGTKPSFVLYVELEDFQIQAMSDGLHEVRLAQELRLYTETGTTVWEQPPVRIVDASRNRRRDFFTTQVVRMPATLGVGRYLLSLTVTDEIGNAMDETKIPLEVVASTSLADQSGR